MKHFLNLDKPNNYLLLNMCFQHAFLELLTFSSLKTLMSFTVSFKHVFSVCTITMPKQMQQKTLKYLCPKFALFLLFLVHHHILDHRLRWMRGY